MVTTVDVSPSLQQTLIRRYDSFAEKWEPFDTSLHSSIEDLDPDTRSCAEISVADVVVYEPLH